MSAGDGIETRCRCRTAEQRKSCRCPSSVKRYRAVYRAADGRKVTETFDRRAEAVRWRAAQLTDLARGLHVDPRAGGVLFADWREEWAGTRTGKASARAADRSRLKCHLAPAFDHLPLTGITPRVVRQWVARLETGAGGGRPLGAKTVRHCHGLLHLILEAAVEERLIATNPCDGTSLPEWVRADPVFLTEEETQALIAAVDEPWRPLVILLASTGLRFGEAVGLRRRFLDLARRELHVRFTWHERFGWQPSPKTSSSRRTIGLPAVAVDALAEAWARPEAGPDEPVLVSPFSGGVIGHGYFTGHKRRRGVDYLGPWRRAVRDAGLAAKAPTPHDLRHTHASQLIAAGVPLTAIQRRLGHKTINTTSDLYGHLLPRVDEALIAAVDLALTPTGALVVPDDARTIAP